MGKFLQKGLLFFAIVVICTTASVFSIIELNRIMFRRIIIEDNVHTLIMGDSHTIFGINDSLFRNTRNLSRTAEGYIFSYLKLKNILDSNPQINRIILGVSFHNFSSYYDEYIYGKDSYSSISKCIALIDYPDLIKLLKMEMSMSNIRSTLQYSFKNILNYKKGEYPFIGNTNISKTSVRTSHNTIMKTINDQYYSSGKPDTISAINVFYLNKIVDLCRTKNIEIIFLNMPLYAEYFNKIPLNIINHYNASIEKFDVVAINLNNLKFPEDYFFPDGEHLSYKGAVIASEFLAKSLNDKVFFSSGTKNPN